MRREKRLASIIITMFVLGFLNAYSTESQSPIANLVFKTNGGGVRPDYGLYIGHYLRDIGIETEVKVEEWTVFLGTLFLAQNYDLCVLDISPNLLYQGEKAFPYIYGNSFLDMREIFSENGSLNIFGLKQGLPYYDEIISLQNRTLEESDPWDREILYSEFQYLILDKIIPFIPLFYPQNYEVVWSNTLGYDPLWGISNSLPYMSYDGSHEGQTNQSEFNIADANWKELNPAFIVDSASYQVADFLFEPIIQIDTTGMLLDSGIVENWIKVNDFHYKFTIRDNLWWNPSYNATSRNSSSLPLALTPEGELMVGLKNGEFSNGTNQQIKAKDAVFTYLILSNPLIKSSTDNLNWISNIFVDPIDDLSFHIYIDGNPQTPQLEMFIDIWSHLPKLLLPEFFLNSTDPTVSYSSGGVKTVGIYPGITETPQWKTFSKSSFGCGKFLLDYYVPNSKTVLQKSSFWFGIGAKDGNSGKRPFIDTLNIRVIPDVSVTLVEFKFGKLDWIDITLFNEERKSMEEDIRYTVQRHLSRKLSVLAFNLRRPFIGGSNNYIYLDSPSTEGYTKGAAIRKAIGFAINRDEMNQVMHDGEYVISHSFISPYLYYYTGDIPKFSYDIDAAFCWLNGINPNSINDVKVHYYVVPIIFLPIIFLVSLPPDFWKKMLSKFKRKS